MRDRTRRDTAPERKNESARNGALRGIGICNAIEQRDRSISLADFAATGASLCGEAAYSTGSPTFPNGILVCEGEIDPATGRVAVERYTTVDALAPYGIGIWTCRRCWSESGLPSLAHRPRVR